MTLISPACCAWTSSSLLGLANPVVDIKVGAAAQIVADQLTAGGLSTVVDARDLQLPGAWLTVNALSFDRLDSSAYEVTWDLFLVVPDVAAPDALDQLGVLLSQARAAGLDTGSATAITMTLLNHSAEPLPAFQLQLINEIRETE